jgi:uncharacterized repeat protein (TIGR02543 family)
MSAHDVLRKKVRGETKKICCPDVYFRVVYEKNNTLATGAQTDTKKYTKKDLVVVLDKGTMAYTGFVFIGWNTERNGSGISYVADSTFLIQWGTVLYAQWVPFDTLYYTINYVNYNTDRSVSYLKQTTATVDITNETAERSGYIFLGWNTDTEGYGITYSQYTNPILKINGNLTLFAQFTQSFISTFTITYKLNNNSVVGGTENTRETYIKNEPIPVLPVIIASGFDFTGWNTLPDGSGSTFGVGSNVRESFTLFAQWTVL